MGRWGLAREAVSPARVNSPSSPWYSIRCLLPLLLAHCLPHSANSSLHFHYQPLVMTVCTAMFSTAGLCSLRYISGAASLHKGSYLPAFSQKLSIRARARPRQPGFQLGLENKTHAHNVKYRPTHFYEPVVLQVLPKKSKKDLCAVIRNVNFVR